MYEDVCQCVGVSFKKRALTKQEKNKWEALTHTIWQPRKSHCGFHMRRSSIPTFNKMLTAAGMPFIQIFELVDATDVQHV